MNRLDLRCLGAGTGELQQEQAGWPSWRGDAWKPNWVLRSEKQDVGLGRWLSGYNTYFTNERS